MGQQAAFVLGFGNKSAVSTWEIFQLGCGEAGTNAICTPTSWSPIGYGFKDSRIIGGEDMGDCPAL